MKSRTTASISPTSIYVSFTKMVAQVEIVLPPYPKGFHLVTRTIEEKIAPLLPESGLLNLFIHHTSAALSINENADPSVRTDFETFVNNWIPESYPHYTHVDEGADDMPAHIKSSTFGASINIPISDRKLKLGTWQGIYLCEFRRHGGSRKITATIIY